MRSRILWLLLLALGVGLVTTATASAVPPAGCDNRANNTPSKLVECITSADLMAHMQAFQAIADANPGPDGHASRNSGEPGYKASVDYVAKAMKDAGYNVTIQQYTFPYSAFVGTPSFSEVSPTARTFTVNVDWLPGTGNGDATGAQLKPAGGIVLPPTPTPSSASGCDPADFSGMAGKIALVQRGTCTFGAKVQNATAAGAVGIVIFNEGNPTRTGLLNGNVGFAATIPVAFTTFALGQSLYNEYSAGTPPVLNLSVHSVVDPNRTDYNVIADSKTGDPNHVLVVDAHLDAIYGAGMLDNASGSAAILDIAQKMKRVVPRNKLRFIWFGGEELGLLGSKFYVGNLSPTDLGQIFYDLDADVFGTPNYVIGILDPAAPDFFSRTVSTQFPPNVYEPSKISEQQSIDFFDAAGFNHELFSPIGTDAQTFNLAGIPASGLLTGQDCCKNQGDVDLFGGFLGNFEGNVPSFDGGCVDLPFRWCDNISNVDPNNMELMSKAFANTVVRMAFATPTAASASQQSLALKRQLPPAAVARGLSPSK
jgi:Zn-dependent M28 family amino/carboxypeptidase